MQQTDKYKLNLIEKDDVFSPDALNENMEKVEAQFASIRAESAAADAAESAARAAFDAALDQRLQVFESRRLAHGTYKPRSGGLDIALGFRPFIVLIQAVGSYLAGVLTLDAENKSGAITNDGFHINSSTSSGTITNSSYTFAYLALG